MLKRTFTYVDFDGNEVSDDYYFNMNRAERLELQLSAYGGLDKMMRRLTEEKNTEEIVKMFKKIILMTVGEKSYDGKRFVKNDEIRNNFYQSEAYSQLFCELVTEPEKAEEFLMAVVEGYAEQKAKSAEEEAAKEAGAQALAPVT